MANETRAQKCDRLGNRDKDWIADCETMLAEEAGVTADDSDFLSRLGDREAWRDGQMFDHLSETEKSDVYQFFIIDSGELGVAEWACRTKRLPRVNSQVRIWASRLFSASMQRLVLQEHSLSLELLGVGNSLTKCDLERLTAARMQFRERELAVKSLFGKRYSEL